METNKKLIILIVIAAFILVILWVAVTVFSRKQGSDNRTGTSIMPTSLPLPQFDSGTKKTWPQKVQNLPTLIPTKGAGVDMTAQKTQQSIAEINKLAPNLPFSADIKTSTGRTISIYIPSPTMQDSPWALMVHVDGIEYTLPEDDSLYPSSKVSFLESAKYIVDWLKSKNVDTRAITVIWGDRDFIQNRSEQWLRESGLL